jgi:cell division protein FtsN
MQIRRSAQEHCRDTTLEWNWPFMHADNDRETELVLGTKQLLGLLFLSFVLLGVFFSMGYVLGRNSVPTDTARRTEAGQGSDRPTATRPPAISGSAPAPAPQSESAVPPGQQPGASAPSAPAESASTAAATRVAPRQPEAGEVYLQVSAVAKEDADLLADVLDRKGFRTLITPAPREGIYRVLVGPAKSDAEIGKLRTELEQAGFKSIPRRY